MPDVRGPPRSSSAGQTGRPLGMAHRLMNAVIGLFAGGIGTAFGLTNLLFVFALFFVPAVNRYFEFTEHQ